MGMQLEFNWYLVLKNEPEELDNGFILEGVVPKEDKFFRTFKKGARVYPVGGVVPVIKDDKAISLAYIRECRHSLDLQNKIMTVIDYDVIMDLEENPPVASHYTDMYHAYKSKQEMEDHGGKWKLGDFVNALERRDFEKALKELEE